MVAYLSRIEMRRRWRTLALLALLVALVMGTVLASVAGARRSRSSFDRYLAEVDIPQVIAFGDPAALAPISDLPFVVAAPALDIVAAQPVAAGEAFIPLAVSLDGRIPRDYFRLPVVEGRRADPRQALEVDLGVRTARRLAVGVGDTLELQSYTPATALRLGSSDDPGPDGPRIGLRVVGIVRDPGDIGARESDITLTFLTPAFRDRYTHEQVGSLSHGVWVVLRHPGDAALLTAAVGPEVQIDAGVSADQIRDQATPTMHTIATALAVFAAVAGLAGLAAIGYVVARLQRSGAGDDAVLGALGVGRRHRWGRSVVPAGIAVATGTVLGVGLAVLASPLFPIGLARLAEPAQGTDVDVLVLGVGATIALVSAVALVSVLGGLTVRPGAAAGGVQPGRLARRVAEVGAPPVIVTGVALAADGTRAGRSTSAWATGGVAVGVLGVLAAAVFAASVERLVHTPSLYGWGWDANLAGADLSNLDEGRIALDEILADPDLDGVARLTFQIEATVDGTPVYAATLEALKGRVGPVMVEGREPTAANEIALGRDSLTTLGKAVGDSVEVDLGAGPQLLEVTGIVALPVDEDGGSSATGAFLAHPAVQLLGAPSCSGETSCVANLALRLAPEAHLPDVAARYEDRASGVAVNVPAPPGEVERLTAVERLPWYLAGFLALLAAVAVTHSAASAIHRRRRDLAVLRVLGMSAAQLRAVVATQVLTLTVAGVCLGEVLGVIAGRQVWRWVVDSVAFPFSPAIPLAALVLLPLATLGLTQVAATFSRRAAGRIRPALALRTE